MEQVPLFGVVVVRDIEFWGGGLLALLFYFFIYFLFFLNFFAILFIYFFKLFYLFLAALGLCCCALALSRFGERGLLFVAVRGLLIVVASLVAEHGL